MPSEPTYRHRRRLLSAGPRDIQWLHARPHLWTPAHLDLLVERIDELAREEPKVGYAMAAQCLGPIVDQVGEVLPVDLRALGLIAEAQAARRLGLHGEARTLYERVERLEGLSSSVASTLYRRRAVLAFNEEDFDRAMEWIETGLRLADCGESRASGLLIRGNIRARGPSPDPNMALRDYGEACLVALAGSRVQIDALLNLSALSCERGTLEALHTAGVHLKKLRKILMGRRTRSTRRARCYVEWFEGRLLLRSGLASGHDAPIVRRALGRMRRAASALVDLGLVGDALLCTAELAAALATLGSGREALCRCAEILEKIDAPRLSIHYEARAVIAAMVEAETIERERWETLHRELAAKMGRLGKAPRG